jgi:hypothetical protein
MARDDKTMVEVRSLGDFTGTLDARLAEAHALSRGLVDTHRRTAPALGGLPDADYVRDRYLALYDEHVERVIRLIRAVEVAQGALRTIADNYTSNEQRLSGNAAEIGRLLDGVSGALNGGQTNAG